MNEKYENILKELTHPDDKSNSIREVLRKCGSSTELYELLMNMTGEFGGGSGSKDTCTGVRDSLKKLVEDKTITEDQAELFVPFLFALFKGSEIGFIAGLETGKRLTSGLNLLSLLAQGVKNGQMEVVGPIPAGAIPTGGESHKDCETCPKKEGCPIKGLKQNLNGLKKAIEGKPGEQPINVCDKVGHD